MLRASRCGGLLLAAGGNAGFRVFDTSTWAHQSYHARFRRPCAAAEWSGEPPVCAEAATRTLVVALEAEPFVHALRFGGRAAASRGNLALGEYLGAFDLVELAASAALADAASAPAAPPPRVAGVRFLAWDASGQRLAVGWYPAPTTDGGGTSAQQVHLALLVTRTKPSLALDYAGSVVGHSRGAALAALAFSASLPRGALLSACWDDGHISLLPMYF